MTFGRMQNVEQHSCAYICIEVISISCDTYVMFCLVDVGECVFRILKCILVFEIIVPVYTDV